MKNKYVIAPRKRKDYLTPGRKYKILWIDMNFNFRIKADNGDTLFCLYKKCAHISGGDWIIVKE